MGDMKEIQLPEIIAFDWDNWNIRKSWLKHNVEPIESEQVFHDYPIYLADEKHSQIEKRYLVYGLTDKGRRLSIAFTFRNNKIRIISTRDQSKRERRFYEKTKTNSKIQK